MSKPRPKHSEPADAKEPPVPFADLALAANVRAYLDGLCTQARAIKAQMAELEADYEPIKAEVNRVAAEAGLPRRTVAENWEIRQTSGSKTEIDGGRLRQALLMRGVELEVIEAAIDAATERKSWSGYAVFAVKRKAAAATEE
jgi:hypothetical protein